MVSKISAINPQSIPSFLFSKAIENKTKFIFAATIAVFLYCLYKYTYPPLVNVKIKVECRIWGDRLYVNGQPMIGEDVTTFNGNNEGYLAEDIGPLKRWTYRGKLRLNQKDPYSSLKFKIDKTTPQPLTREEVKIEFPKN